MALGIFLVILFNVFVLSISDQLPTNYEYYTSDGISSGLSADQPYFTLNGKNISIYSGAVHYFRVPRPYWRDRLKKTRAAGLNTVETYVAWNLHEPQSGVYDFGSGGSEMEDFLHLEEFLRIAQEEDLFVILRTGPYICSEYNFGGFPSWLLREKEMGYYNVLLPILKDYQFTKGGPVIAFQLENEYGYVQPDDNPSESDYLEKLHEVFVGNGIVELFVTSDGISSTGLRGTVPSLFLQTANFGSDPEGNLNKLVELQPGRPVMTMEYWIGWFDYWTDDHHTVKPDTSKDLYERILKFPASVNIYMFHGGTNFGFTNGGSFSNNQVDNSGFRPITTSYDYDSPLNEGGDYTDKYFSIKELLEKYNPVKTYVPDPPDLIPKIAYPAVSIKEHQSIAETLDKNAPYTINSETVIPMEKLDINNGSGQSVGYIAYRKENIDLKANTTLKIEGHICDTAIVLVDGVLVSPVLESKDDIGGFGYWHLEDSTLVINTEEKSNATVDIIVEEWGRVNSAGLFQYNKSFKGLWQGDVFLNDEKVSDWKIVPLEFKKDWTDNLQGWSEKISYNTPGLFKANLEISSEPSDTYLDMRKWTKGLVIVNGFPLGKYAKIGPQQALYLPAPFLKKGINEIVIFEHFKANDEYYTSDGISSGLSADQPYFTLNGKNISVYSGAMHYFRVPRAYWRDRLKKIRAAGLNTVETYLAWNLHEPQSGVYDFGSGGSEMEDFLHVEEFLKMAQEEDLFVILRTGPYICAEFNFGGFPSWLLREEQMGFRTSEPTYLKYVERYYNVLLPVLKGYQFTKGGPVIAFQLENEFGYMQAGDTPPDTNYIKRLYDIFIENGIVELFVTSDGVLLTHLKGTIPNLFLQTANFGSLPETNLNQLVELQPDRPVMVMEYWIGWYDHWSENHHTVKPNASKNMYETILKFPASVNIYMFHGGTNFGFTNGGGLSNLDVDNSGYDPITTSYDYDSPLNEAGDYTDKYFQVKELLEKYNPVQTYVPNPPDLIPKVAYPVLSVEKQLVLSEILDINAPYVITSETVVAMEKIDINNGSGQGVGYIAYRKQYVDLEANTTLKIKGHICDTAIVLVDGVLVSPVLDSKKDLNGFGYWRLKDSTLVITSEKKSNATVDIVVEEWGRVNAGVITQYNRTFKGLWQGDVFLNDEKVSDWKIVPLEFKKDWTNNLQGWSEKISYDTPGLFKANLEISSEPSDTYLDMRKWTKGLVIVNGFPLGKYAKIGPQQALYLPAPFLKKGINDIVIFEHFKANGERWKSFQCYNNFFPFNMSLGSLLLVALNIVVLSVSSDKLPTNYEYYTSDGISSGLSADQPYFTLNGKNISIYSGAMHYFRVPRAYWRDRLKKIRAAGLNTVETYVAWNLHEPQSGVYDFGNGGSEMEDFLHIEEFLKTAQEEDLFVILRTGPYICAEYNFGGFPSWLLREKQMGFRTQEPTYSLYVERYYSVLLPILKEYQFTKGGPVIAFQLENEFGYTQSGTPAESDYLKRLYEVFVGSDIVELFVTSDGILSTGLRGTIPSLFLHTANFGSDPEKNLNKLVQLQPNRPVMTMEFWIGWFDYWSDNHHTVKTDTSTDLYERILKFPASVNIYMFHGGTNFGFTSGGGLSNDAFDNSGFEPIITSYDYDSPLNEGGDYTDKYFSVKKLLEKYNPVKTYVPDPPDLIPKIAYPAVSIQKHLPIAETLDKNAPYTINSETVIPMEKLDINDGSGQSVGYIVYRKENIDLKANTILKIKGHICDTAIVLVDGVLVSPILNTKKDLDGFGYWRLEDPTLAINAEQKSNATVDIIVEEWGRVNFANINQYNKTFKGLWQGDVFLNDEKVSDWKIVPLEFKKDWTDNLQGWSEKISYDTPGLFKANLEISSEPSDTYLDMRKWTKGLVVVNGFPLGKYAKIGPQQSLYLPAPFLKKGTNEIVIFEQFKANDELNFVTKPVWQTV
ncbi:hypothetical protein NQ315_005238 [Exocentrus adspersus]|uniref:Beta-galactosidase n=1 Tax=Exocentrus adspersus TaxID=1586481 RepID=A0AAV8W1J2_9CUCU|nr:hypothetical protein NQ315_005238 [Exocentrus adspersus]